MRHAFPSQPGLQTIPIEKIHLPLHSRDQLPPLLAGLQWLWTHPTLKTEIFALLAAKICASKKVFGHQTLRDNVALLDHELLSPDKSHIF